MKKALLVGINTMPGAPLRGCINDVQDWHGVLTTVGKYNPDDIRVVADDRATTQGIRDRMAWLREGMVGAGDEVIFCYSGHGSQIRDRGASDELADHMDEIMCPVDLDWNTKVITDDDIGDWLKTFPAGVRVILVFDCCHSGSIDRGLEPPNNPHYKAPRFLPPPMDIYLRAAGLATQKDVKLTKFGTGLVKRAKGWREARAKTKEVVKGWSWFGWGNSKPKPKPPPPKPVAPPTPVAPTDTNHILIAGCRDDQTSADAFINNRYNGALTRFVINEIAKGAGRSVADIGNAARAAILSAGYTQEAQVVGSAKLLNAPLFS